MKNRCWPYEQTELKRRKIKIIIKDAKALFHKSRDTLEAEHTHSFLSPLPSPSSSTHQRWGCPRGLCSSQTNLYLRLQGSSSPVRYKEKIRAGRVPLDENELTRCLRSLLGLSACGTCWRPGAASWEQPESSGEGWGVCSFLQCERWKCSPEQSEDCFGDKRHHFTTRVSLVFLI